MPTKHIKINIGCQARLQLSAGQQLNLLIPTSHLHQLKLRHLQAKL